MPTGENTLRRFTPEALQQTHAALLEAGGHEVFLAGTTNTEGLVTGVRVLARGHATAVPALFDSLDVREVVIHNHPSGDLTPSNADLQLASMYSAHGHGVFIVDNEVLLVYVVVEPFLKKKSILLDTREMDAFLRPNGPLARHLESFEIRPQQVQMIEALADAFNQDTFAVIEAPTGVGKTMAYLIPAILWAVHNKERVVVSTRTINLQEQIVFKDIPLLKRCLKEKFEACLVKGRGNYLCWRKLNRAFEEMSLFEDESLREQLHAIADWAGHTLEGSLSDLTFVPQRELWDKVNSEADTCAGNRCPDQSKCFVGRARRAMAQADILVVNHHMFFSDMSVKRATGDFTAMAVLPVFRRVIFDEAHSIEDSATEYLGINASYWSAQNLFSRLVRHESNRDRGLVPLIKARLIKNCPKLSADDYEVLLQLLDMSLLPALETARQAVMTMFLAVRALAAERSGQIGRDIKWRLTETILAWTEMRELHQECTMPAVEALRILLRTGDELVKRLKQVPAPGPEDDPPMQGEVIELTAYLERMRILAATLQEITAAEMLENTVRWVEIDGRNERIVRLVRCPLQVAEPLAEWVYTHFRTVVMTSATLTVQQRFDYLFERLGLNKVPAARISSISLDSPFNFSEQAFLCVPTDGCSPTEKPFTEQTVDDIRAVLAITKGHAFVLFTSFQSLNHAYRVLELELRESGITPLCQGKATRSQLLEEFRRDRSSVLFATDSFWEGVDVAGDALQCVILPRLPFKVPTEPIHEARAEAIEAASGNSFMNYSVPQAVIKFRQGFGRLIRRRTDWGAVVILDKRVVTKYYGKIFLESLPGMPLVRQPRAKIFERLAAFFHERRQEG